MLKFGSELMEWIFEKNRTRLVVLSTDVSAESSETGELAEDLLAIVTVFVARHNGLRSAANRKILPKRFKSSRKEVKKLPAGKVQRIRIYPNQQERLKLRRWMGTAR